MKYIVNGAEHESPAVTGLTVLADGERRIVKGPDGTTSGLAVRVGDTTYVSYQGRTYEIKKATAMRTGANTLGSGDAVAPMPGQIVEISVKTNQKVEVGEKLAVLEAMKMQLPVKAGIAGTVKEIKVAVGDQVSDGQVLVIVEETSA